MTPQASILPGEKGLYDLKIKGLFIQPHWMVFLFSGLSEKQISVVEGQAKSAVHIWDSHFKLDFRRSVATPNSIDYLALAGRRHITPVANHGALPRLDSFYLRRRPDSSLEMRLSAPDEIGFLGRLLGEVSSLALYPTEMVIKTVSMQIQDSIAFRGIGGAPPSETIELALETLLSGLVRSV